MAMGLSIRRVLAALLLPASLVPVLLLAPTLARAPATLVVRLERMVAPAHARVYPAPYEPPRYPIGAARLERDVFETVARVLTPQVGVSPLAEHETARERARRPIILIAPGQESGVSPGAPAAVTPGVPAAVTPGVPAAVTPGVPAAVTPGVPAAVTPGVPAAVTPGVPAAATPGVPAAAPPVHQAGVSP
jgi:hypothetical protein